MHIGHLLIHLLWRQVNYIQSEDESAELRRQVKAMFLDPWLWAGAGILICVVGISLESVNNTRIGPFSLILRTIFLSFVRIPPVPASVGVLILAGIFGRRHFQV